jgi:hypothetical protein
VIYRWEIIDDEGSVPEGRLKNETLIPVQSSLRDFIDVTLSFPSDKSLGYFRRSLRDEKLLIDEFYDFIHGYWVYLMGL